MVIFDRIKQLKEQDLSISEIRQELERAMQTGKTAPVKLGKTGVQSGKTGTGLPAERVGDEAASAPGPAPGPDLLQMILELNNKLQQEKDKRLDDVRNKDQDILELQREKGILEGSLKLLPEGKSPAEIKADYEREQKRKRDIARKLAELKTLGSFSFRRRKQLIKEIEELTEGRGQGSP
jgi:DNA-binding transcriptional MerR regulator